MPASTVTTNVSLLKRLWGDDVKEAFYGSSRALQNCKKDTGFTNESRYVIVSVAPTSGGSSNFADAVASQDTTQEVRFNVTRKKEYQVFTLDGEFLAATRGKPAAMVDGLKNVTEKAQYAFGRAMASRLWGNGGGSLGQIDSGVNLASTTLTLRQRADMVRLEPGAYLQFSVDDGTAVSPAGTRGPGNTLRVSSRGDHSVGAVTVSALLNTIPSITVSDFVFRRGDYNNAMTGIRGWAPTTAPTLGVLFFGVDRALIDSQRTSGIRVASQGTKENTLIQAGAEAQLAGCDMAMDFYVNPLDYADILREFGAKRERSSEKDGKTGFSFLEVYSANGASRVIAERDVPRGFSWGYAPENLTLRTAGECPMLLNQDGVGALMRLSDDDAYQGRIGAYGNFFVENPGHVVAITW